MTKSNSLGVQCSSNSTKGILCNTYKWHVAMHSQVPCDCVGWIGPNRVQVENNCILSLFSECTINPSPRWNFRQFLEPGQSLSGSNLSSFSSLSTSNPICVIFRTSHCIKFKSSSLLYPLFRLGNLKLERKRKCWAFSLLPSINSCFGSSRLVRERKRDLSGKLYFPKMVTSMSLVPQALLQCDLAILP